MGKDPILDERSSPRDHRIALKWIEKKRSTIGESTGAETVEIADDVCRQGLSGEVPNDRAQLVLTMKRNTVIYGVDTAVRA